MTTRHVLDRLPLWVEGDLDQVEAETIRIHLSLCASCRMAAESLHTSQSWLRDAMASPFDASDGDALRRSVMDQVRKDSLPRGPRLLPWRPALLAACAAVLLLAMATWRPETAGTSPQPQTKPHPPEPQLEAEMASITPSPRRPPARTGQASGQEAGAPSQGSLSRIELQTSDPTVRIIWLAQATPTPEPIRSIQEEP